MCTPGDGERRNITQVGQEINRFESEGKGQWLHSEFPKDVRWLWLGRFPDLATLTPEKWLCSWLGEVSN